MSDPTSQPAGWYDDPTMVNTRRYWDGRKWTEHRQEVATPKAAAVEDQPASNWITWGYLGAVFFPIAGLIIGISRIGAEPKWAWKVIGLSIAMPVLYVILFVVNHQ